MNLSQEDRAVLSLARSALIDFTTLFNKGYTPNWHHRQIAEKLEAVMRGEIDRLIITMPPRHGKSTLSTIGFPAYFIGHKPDKQIMTISYNDELAKKFGREVRELIKEPAYNIMFDVELAEDSQAKNRFHTKQGGVYLASGIMGSLTGMGADILLIDDPIKNKEEADSQAHRDKIYDWFTSTAYTRLEKNGAVILIQTRWHEDDLAGRLIAEGGWEHLDLPAIAIEDEEHRKKGEALWSEKYDEESLQRIKSAISARDWWSLYQQRPTVQEDSLFQPEWFRYWEELPDDLYYVTLVDSAFSQKESADYSVVTTIGIKDSKWYICEYSRGKWNPADLIDKICIQLKKWNPVTVGVETIAAQTVIGFYLQEKMQELHIHTQMQEIKQKSAKEVKIQRLVPKMRDGKIIHHRSMLEMEAEFLAFPTGKHDDIIDTIQMCDELKIVNASRPAQAPQGLEFLEDMNLQFNEFGEPM